MRTAHRFQVGGKHGRGRRRSRSLASLGRLTDRGNAAYWVERLDAIAAGLPAYRRPMFGTVSWFLEANAQTLLRRFSETRRRHPLTMAGLALAEAIERERVLLSGVADLGHRIDTSELLPRALQSWIKELVGLGGGSLTLLFESFAFRDGIPLDADWVIDARMLPNPHYDPALRPLSGRDAAVAAYLDAQPAVRNLIEDVRAFLSRWLPEIEREQRNYVTVAIGCTGGRHRSVYLAERLADAFRADRRVLVRHRGLARTEPETGS